MDLVGPLDRSATVLLGIVSFLLTPQEPKRKIPATFPIAPRSRGDTGEPDRKEIARRFNGLDLLVLTKESPPEYGCRLYLETAGIEGEKACSTCLVGLCNASIRNARREATGCAQACPEENFAAIVVRRCTTYRRRWLHACGCGLARWAATGHRGVPQDVRGSRQSRALGPARPDTIGASRPRRFPSSSI